MTASPNPTAPGPLRLAALVKQTPRFESMELGDDGRIVREGLELEMGAYCRRATAQAVALAEEHGGTVTVLTMGPPSARDVLREALTHADEHGVEARGALLSDPALAGSDTLATARALAAALDHLAGGDPFDAVLCGRNSVDADTGQVGPELAELTGWPFLTGVKELRLVGAAPTLVAGCELDDAWEDVEVDLPVVLSAAERLIDPCKIKDPSLWVPEDDPRIVELALADLGPGPWGAAASPTSVGRMRTEEVDRERRVLDGPVAEQVAEAVAVLEARGLLDRDGDPRPPSFGAAVDLGPCVAGPSTGGEAGPVVAVVAEPGRERLTRELLAAAAGLAADLGGRVVALGTHLGAADPEVWSGWGADELTALVPTDLPVGTDPDEIPEEDVAAGVAGWAGPAEPWAVLLGGTSWGREVAARTAATLGAGLTGDAVALEVDDDGRLVAWKPAFGGAVVAAIHCSSPIQLATVRVGVLPLPGPRQASPAATSSQWFDARSRLRILGRRPEDDVDVLAEARRVVGVGQAVPPERYGELDGLREVLGAELAATRKVTDQGWLPHARQLGITGRAIAPELYVALGTSGKYNHMVGVRAAGTVIAVNPDPAAPVFDFADVGIVGDWAEVVPELERRLRSAGAR